MATTILTGTSVVFPDGTSDTTAQAEKGVLLNISAYGPGTYTWTAPAGTTNVWVRLIGGGGGSAGYAESGGAGGFAEGVYNISAGTAVTVTVGGGGAGVTYYAVAGTGGTTSFGSYLSATGGGGANSYIQHGGGAGGVGSGGAVNLYGGTGSGHCNGGGHAASGYGGSTYFGGTPAANRNVPGSSPSYGGTYGAGAPGNRTNDGSVGGAANGGLVLVYAYT